MIIPKKNRRQAGRPRPLWLDAMQILH